MLNKDALALLSEIEKAMASGKYKPIGTERDFLLKIGSVARTPQKITLRQGEYLQGLYRASQGHYQKRWSRIERAR